MSREIAADLRTALEEPRSAEYVVVMLRIEHDTLTFPILVANDVVNYVVGDETYLGFPFKMEVIGDTGQVPRGNVQIQNVDRRIGEAIVNLTTPPRVSILMFAQSDFSDPLSASPGVAEDTRYELQEGTTPEYEAHHLIFGNITVDAMQVSAEITSFDMTNEPWPAIRSTADRLPGLDP